jgi:hypothetical protein
MDKAYGGELQAQKRISKSGIPWRQDFEDTK